MKIVFWQPYHMEYGSEYLSKAIAGISALLGETSILVEAPEWEEWHKEELSDILVAESGVAYYRTAKDLSRIVDVYREDGWCPTRFLKENVIGAGRNCFRIPYHIESGSEAAYQSLTPYCKKIFHMLSYQYQHVFWDVGRLQGSYLNCFLKEADLVVIILENNQERLDSFCETFHRFQGKFFYLISGADFHGHLSKQTILQRYRIEETYFGNVKHYRKFFSSMGKNEIMWRIAQEYERRNPNNFGEECMQIWRKIQRASDELGVNQHNTLIF